MRYGIVGSSTGARPSRCDRTMASCSAPRSSSRWCCSAPPRSSHTLELLRPVLARAEVAESLMRTRLVVPSDPAAEGPPRLGKTREGVQPHALLLRAAEEALHDPVLLRRVGRDELLAQSVV